MLKRLLKRGSKSSFEDETCLIKQGHCSSVGDQLELIQLIDQSVLFDDYFYVSQSGLNAFDRHGLILHYLEEGAKKSYDPHPLFDTKFYLERANVPATINPLIHFLRSGWREFISPHPLFDPKYYLATYPDVAIANIDPLQHYIAKGAAESRNPSPAFNGATYLAKLGANAFFAVNPLCHYVQHGALNGAKVNRTLMSHYRIEKENAFGRSKGFARFCRVDEVTCTADLLFDKYAELLKESSLFDYELVKAQLCRSGILTEDDDQDDIIANYFRFWKDLALLPNILFDTKFYYETNSDVDFNSTEPLSHYLEQGWLDGRNPHPLFDNDLYIMSNPDVERARVNPLRHFFLHGIASRRFSYWFDGAYYLSQYSKQRIRSALRKNKHAWSRERYSSKWFTNYPEVRKNLLLDYLLRGATLDIHPRPNFQDHWQIQKLNLDLDCYRHAVSVCPKVRHLTDKQFQKLFFALTPKVGSTGIEPDEDYLYFCGHEASRTGAPMVLLGLIQELDRRNVKCIVVLKRGGAIEKLYSKYAHVVNLDLPQSAFWGTARCREITEILFTHMKCKRPKVCIVNSVESSGLTSAFSNHGIKTITLVHEILDSYKQDYLTAEFLTSDLKVFPALAVLKLAQQKTGFDFQGDSKLLPSPALSLNFAMEEKCQARKQLRDEITADENSLVILCCGTPDLRKGIDTFFSVAQAVLAQTKLDIRFIWIGGSEVITPFSVEYYVDWDIRTAELQNKIHILPARPDLRVAFNGADIFMVTSRQDPFPCVAHNAMVASLPIVAFQDAGGVPEMVQQQCGIVPYGDVSALANAVLAFADNENLRSTVGARNRIRALEEYDLTHYADTILNYVCELST